MVYDGSGGSTTRGEGAGGMEKAARGSREFKYHTSNDVFSRCKSVHKMATGKSDDELIQSDNKMRIGTRSGQIITVDGT